MTSIKPETVLVVDDDPIATRVARERLRDRGYLVDIASSADEALRYLDHCEPGAIVLDLGLPDRPGTELLRDLLLRRPDALVVVHSGKNDLNAAVECMRRGAVDFVPKSDPRSDLSDSVDRAFEARRERGEPAKVPAPTGAEPSTLLERPPVNRLVGGSPGMLQVKTMIERASHSAVTVLLRGESGTGKEVAARMIHELSDRRDGPFVALNCGAVPENLIESELFGHVPGAFTGASKAKVGYFERASGGTLFLDEVGELRLDLQVRLLRVLQERRVTRVGDAESRPIDIRIVSATNRDLQVLTAEGHFRLDLYYRLAVFPIEMPALRERDADVISLAEIFLREFANEIPGEHSLSLSGDAIELLERYEWPGNVRELRNVIERACLLSADGRIEPAHLPPEMVAQASQ